jgi:tRNA/rRNA methyltransferase
MGCVKNAADINQCQNAAMDNILPRVRIVLSHTSHPGNIGAAARAMMVMGLADLCLINPKKYPDREATDRASGALGVLDNAKVVTNISDALADCSYAVACTARARDLTHTVFDARSAAAKLITEAASGPVALVFGNERIGLTNEEVLACDAVAHIPVNPKYSSLNVAAAVQVFCYELRMAAGQVQIPASNSDAFEKATHAQVEGLLQHIGETAVAIGYLDPANPRNFMPRMQRLFSRARLEREEIDLLRGMLRAAQRRG